METSPSTFGLILDPKIADLSGRHSNYQPDAVHQDLKDLQPILLIYARKSGVSRQIRLHPGLLPKGYCVCTSCLLRNLMNKATPIVQHLQILALFVSFVDTDR
ncbi:MAG: hypothetical protein HC780_23995 [Leptolyngbyaceae cyanobacterium CSU_1_3]|nr:hypothetical protein [Leptolyngbyaceae cyanobacterium CSU_1_3]